MAWTFATVRIYNRPLPGFLRALIVRAPAECCEVSLEFREPGREHLALPAIEGRWSSQPEPIRPVLVADDNGMPAFVTDCDLSMIPQTKRIDLAAGTIGEEVAIAIQRADGTAHAFGAESYLFYKDSWKNPRWELKPQVYDVTVRVRASGLNRTRRFRLNNLEQDFSKFTRLESA